MAGIARTVGRFSDPAVRSRSAWFRERYSTPAARTICARRIAHTLLLLCVNASPRRSTTASRDGHGRPTAASDVCHRFTVPSHKSSILPVRSPRDRRPARRTTDSRVEAGGRTANCKLEVGPASCPASCASHRHIPRLQRAIPHLAHRPFRRRRKNTLPRC